MRPESDTEQVLRTLLEGIHPRYEQARAFGSEALPYLLKILKTPDDRLGPRVVFLASQIGGEESLELIRQAVRHPDKRVRAAVAFVLPELPVDQLGNVPIRLLSDPDPQVTYHTIRSINKMGLVEFKRRLSNIAEYHPAEYVRAAASKSLAGAQLD